MGSGVLCTRLHGCLDNENLDKLIGTCVEKHSLGSPVRAKHNMRQISAKNGTNADSISEDFVVPRSGSLGIALGPPFLPCCSLGRGGDTICCGLVDPTNRARKDRYPPPPPPPKRPPQKPPPTPPPPPPLYKRQKSVFFSLPKKILAPNKADFGVAKLNAPYFSEYLSRAILSPRYRPMPPFLARRWGGSWPKIALIGS